MDSPIHVVLAGGIAALGKELIQAHLECECQISVLEDRDAVSRNRRLLEQADVIVGWPLSADLIAAAPKVRLVQAAGAGVDGLPFELLPSGAAVANTYHHESSIAEHVLLAMLLFTRRPLDYDRRLRQGDWWDSCIWGQWPHLEMLAGKTALLVGTGHIAREVARRARAFSVITVAVSRRPETAPPDFDRTVGYGEWLDELREADFLVPCCPLTAETEGLVSEAAIARMKPTAVLINAARGRIVDERALYEALRGRRIAGAAVDVWYRYPSAPGERCLPSEYPFHELDNVLLTPHVSAWTRRTVEGRMRDIADNINRLARGEPLRNVVWVQP
jgi:phosphoglycerate dehydrogenase-like enzyme